MPNKPDSTSAGPATRRSRTFRIFVCSTFDDLRAERNALQAHVFPRLRELCQRHGCRFQAIDLRWGVSTEAALDQQTMIICLHEIERCHAVTPKPNFLVLLGDRDGWLPPPPRILASEFETLLELVMAEDADLLLWKKEQPEDKKGWYRLDENADPKEYRLRPRQSDFSYCKTRDEAETARKEEATEWRKTEPRLQGALARAARKAALPTEARLKYESSATAQEISAGALRAPQPEGKVFCFFRTIEGARDKAGRPLAGTEMFIDQDPAPVKALKSGLERSFEDFPDAIKKYEARWEGDGPSTDHIGTLPDDLDDCLTLLDAKEPPDTICVGVWRGLARTILREIELPTALPLHADEIIHVPPDDSLEAEGLAHCDFANRLLRFFVGRETPLRAVRDYFTGEGVRTLVVAAGGGAGKSALMAKALEIAKAAYPRAHVIYRFIGATPSSSDGRSLLVSLCQEISRRYALHQEVPYDYNELVADLEKRMRSATIERPLLLFLDALDQISEAHGARNLIWLPRQLPEGVRVVVSTRVEADTYTAATRLGPEEVKLGAMSRGEGDDLLGCWLKDAGRNLTGDQRTKVLDAFEHKSSNGRPLYLKLAFEEARLWPSYAPAEDLQPGIEGIIQKNTFPRLVLEQSHGEKLVARTVGYLTSSRYGLAEDELLDVLSRDVDLYESFLRSSRYVPPDLVARAVEYKKTPGAKSGKSEKDDTQLAEMWLKALMEDHESALELRRFLGEVLPRRSGPRLPVVLWSRLYFDLEPYLMERMSEGAPLLAFYHPELGKVGAEVYAKDEHGRELHGWLADYFRFRADPALDRSWTGRDVRGLSELPHHLTEAARWEDLQDTLTDFSFLEHKAAEVGVELPGGDGKGETMYTGAYRLQRDFDHALEKIPGGRGVAGGRQPLIVTAVDFGEGHVIRCPWCNTVHTLTEDRKQEWPGQQIICPNEKCRGPLKVNKFLVGRK